MPRPRVPKVPKAQEEPTPSAEAAAEPEEEEDAAVSQEEAPATPATPPPEYLRVIITLRDGRGSIGLQRFGCDPFLTTTPDADLANALARVPELLAAADGVWQERRQNPKYTRPAPRPPAPPRAASRLLIKGFSPQNRSDFRIWQAS